MGPLLTEVNIFLIFIFSVCSHDSPHVFVHLVVTFWRAFSRMLLFIASVFSTSTPYDWCFPTDIVFHQCFSYGFLFFFVEPFSAEIFHCWCFWVILFYFLSKRFFWPKTIICTLLWDNYVCSPTAVVPFKHLCFPTTMILSKHLLLFRSCCVLSTYFAFQMC